MQSFTNYAPTIFLFGRGCVQERGGEILPRYGKRAYIVTGRFIDNKENLALKDIKTLLEKLGIEYGCTEAVEENPSVRSIVNMMPEIRVFKPDFLVAVGGGSAIDSTKTVSVLLSYPEQMDNVDDATRLLYEGAMPFDAIFSEGKLPVFAVPTTAGTGAEVTAFSVITNEQTHAKLTISHPVFCTAAFLDGRYIDDAPELIIHTGAMDALAHAAESYVNKKSTPMNRSYGEFAFKLFSEVKDHMHSFTLTQEDCDKLIMMSNIAGLAFMRSGTTIPHGMGYALSIFKGVSHGLSCSVTLGEYLKIFKEPENQARALRAAQLCGFADIDDMARYISDLAVRHMHISVTEEEIDQWSEQFFNMKYRLTKHPEVITRDDIHRIYSASLAKYIVK